MTAREPGILASYAAALAEQALVSLHREYPCHVSYSLTGDADVRPPRERTPAFFGSYDWHSSVHSHWTVARLVRLFPDAPFAEPGRTALSRSLRPRTIAAERRFLAERAGFERPYGLAWLLELARELALHGEPGKPWRDALAPLADLASERLLEGFAKLPFPIRTGEHNQTAFSMGLALDHAHANQASGLAAGFSAAARRLFGDDRGAAAAFEPSGHDFLSPTLAEADLMRRVLAAEPFAEWLEGFLPDLTVHAAKWWRPHASSAPHDGKLVHLDGLNLSRAWMMRRIAAALPATDTRRASLEERAAAHRRVGLEHAVTEHYAGAHWLGTFALYLES